MAGENDSPTTQPASATGSPFDKARTNGSKTGQNGQRPRPPGPNDLQRPGAAKDAPKGGLGGMRPRPWWISFVLVLVLNYLLVQLFLPEQSQQRIDVPYTFFKQQVAAANVS